VRLTVKNNHNPTDPDNTIELSEFRGFGTQLTHTPLPDLSGTYQTYFTGPLHLKQEGTSVTGCYEARQGRFDGGIEGRALKFTYYEKSGYSVSEIGVGVMVFSPDGKQVFSLWDERGGRERLILGTKKTDEVGMCPEWLRLLQAESAPEVESTAEPTPITQATNAPITPPAAVEATPPDLKLEPSAPQVVSPSPEATSTIFPPGRESPTPSPTTPPGEQKLKPMTIVQAQLTSELTEFGRARVYGINFDSDSDHIKDESKPTLNSIVAMLKRKANWKMSIEGHTDSTSTPQHNQALSERRAASVKNYLTGEGIEASRLSTTGYGQEKPVAPNDNPIGKAQNRRVELVKQ
jgi:outer membrane protein OmpA-like peptidoglycan-associated protein